MLNKKEEVEKLSKMKKNYILLIIKASLVTGSLDILFAFANAWWSAGISPERVLQFIASGLFGKSAFQGLPAIAFLGLAIHYFIAFCWTVLFFFVYSKFKILSGINFCKRYCMVFLSGW